MRKIGRDTAFDVFTAWFSKHRKLRIVYDSSPVSCSFVGRISALSSAFEITIESDDSRVAAAISPLTEFLVEETMSIPDDTWSSLIVVFPGDSPTKIVFEEVM